MTITLDILRFHPIGGQYYEPKTFDKHEILAWGRGDFDFFGERLTSVIVKNKSFPNPTEFQALISYNEARDLLGDEFEKVKIV